MVSKRSDGFELTLCKHCTNVMKETIRPEDEYCRFTSKTAICLDLGSCGKTWGLKNSLRTSFKHKIFELATPTCSAVYSKSWRIASAR